MTAQSLPALFISHGSPMLVFEDIPARHFIAGLGQQLEHPKAILCVSAHWETERATVSAVAAPETIHDFYGFPDELYRLRYPAPGAPALARRVVELLEGAGIDAAIDGDRGLDHGTWNLAPARLSEGRCAGDAAVDTGAARSCASREDRPRAAAAASRRRARAGERRSGPQSAAIPYRPRQPAPWAVSFDEWLADRIAAADEQALVSYRQNRPDGRLAHPRDEHLLPLFVAFGAGGGGAGRPLHRSFAHGSLSMAAYAWD